MERVPQLVRRGKKDRRMGAPSELDWEAIEALRTEMRVELIQELIPLGLAEVGRVLDEEVERLAGPRHARKGEGDRNRGARQYRPRARSARSLCGLECKGTTDALGVNGPSRPSQASRTTL